MPRSSLLLAALAVVATPAAAQTVRFQTSVGAFDMLLNPTGNANLQPHVDNLLANVAAGVYHRSVVNRAVDDFVLQIGSFQTDTVEVGEIPRFGFDPTNSFDPVIVDADNNGQVDFSTAGLTNSRGTVSLALSAGNANSGSASFFVNLTDNSFLDNQDFIPFATISDLATIDRIMNQTIVDLSSTVGQPGSLAYTDVPLAPDGDLIVIENVSVVSGSNQAFLGPLQGRFGLEPTDGGGAITPDPPTGGDLGGDMGMNPDDPLAGLSDDIIERLTAAQIAGLLDGTLTVEQVLASLDLGATATSSSFTSAASAAASTSIPEPTAALLAAIGLAAAARRR